eukprot:TRINITY_DN19738_c0_g3_i1.p1 TRINITY_DN19738_c0_g3~~TRINITY_DN19738_c0_g3_i1.p1  ORF type:complete len:967 (-),score=86.42 TRINITY_DN19738_c0_g3_i1:174-3005(-)
MTDVFVMRLAAFMVWLPGATAFVSESRPYSTVAPQSLGIVSVRRGDAQAPSPRLWERQLLLGAGAGTGSVPTNAWWLNFGLGNGTDEGANANVFQIPYVLWATEGGLAASLPYVLAADDHAENAFDSNVLLVELRARGISSGQRISSHDLLVVQLSWGSEGDANGALTSWIARGSPYLTVEYRHSVPEFTSPMTLDPNQGLRVDGKIRSCSGALTGSSFEMVFVQSDETWKFWSSVPLTMSCVPGPGAALRARAPVTTVVRAAMTNNCTMGRSPFHCASRPKKSAPSFAEVLQQYHNTYPVASRVTTKTTADNVTTAVHIEWQVRHMSAGSKGDKEPSMQLLMTAMEHHRRLGSCDSTRTHVRSVEGTFQRNINGDLTLAIGNEWVLPYATPPVAWGSIHGVAPDKRAEVSEALRKDMEEWEVPENYQTGAGDPYNAGKLLARLATLGLVAEELGERDIVKRIGRKLGALVRLYASGRGLNHFVYDSTWGGFVSCGCMYTIGADKRAYCKNAGPGGVQGGSGIDDCPSLTDPGMDFGNGFFNDHHFQWGYHIYAAAVAAHLNPEWGKRNKELVLLYARDIANPSDIDKYFPVWRHKDWFTGWSWASGFALGGGHPYRNGRNQESTSEAINGYYGLQLLGEALGDEALRDWGRAALASEIIAAQTYWQMQQNDIYPEQFSKSKTVVGILWQNLAQYGTWFGGEPYMIQGIQMLPFIPPSELYLQSAWVKRSIEAGAQSCALKSGCVSDGWSSLFTCLRAVVDPYEAWQEALKLPKAAFNGPAGNGISRTSVLFWIATRPQLQQPAAQPVAWPRMLQCSALPSASEPSSRSPLTQSGSGAGARSDTSAASPGGKAAAALRSAAGVATSRSRNAKHVEGEAPGDFEETASVEPRWPWMLVIAGGISVALGGILLLLDSGGNARGSRRLLRSGDAPPDSGGYSSAAE